MSGRLDGKVAVVTGGANGIVRACCERLAADGAVVVVADLLEESGKATTSALQHQGARALFVALDAADAESNEALMAAAVSEFGSLDILVTAAGISHAQYRSGDQDPELQMLARAAEALLDPPRWVLDLSPAEWQKVLDVNLTGTFLAIQAAARRMIAAGQGGAIVTIGSVASKHPEAGPVSYAVSKAGVWMLTKHVSRSLAPAGIRVNCVGPGYIDTHMTGIFGMIPAVQEQMMTAIPMARMGAPAEVASVVSFLVSNDASYVTGEILHPDGGFYTD